MKRRIVALVLCLAGSASAQQHQHAQMPYAGMQQRPIKALSAEQMADLQAGRGMGLALAAEMNGYPGPSHALELADKLELSAEQRQSLRQLFDRMKSEAIVTGGKLIVREKALDEAFAASGITVTMLEMLTAQIGEAQGELRAVHLKYHLTTADLLSPIQRKRYAELRGYK